MLLILVLSSLPLRRTHNVLFVNFLNSRFSSGRLVACDRIWQLSLIYISVIVRIVKVKLGLVRHPFPVRLVWQWLGRARMPPIHQVLLCTITLDRPTTRGTSFMLETCVLHLDSCTRANHNVIASVPSRMAGPQGFVPRCWEYYTSRH
jgi:hypothetical protein